MARAIVPPFEPATGARAPLTSWALVGLEVLADLVAWTIIFLLLTSAGAGLLASLNIFSELLLIFGLFAGIGLLIRLAFISIRRRPARRHLPDEPKGGAAEGRG